jgi:hypothetical protein
MHKVITIIGIVFNLLLAAILKLTNFCSNLYRLEHMAKSRPSILSTKLRKNTEVPGNSNSGFISFNMFTST